MGALLVVLPMLTCCTGMVRDELDQTRAKLEELKALADTVNLNLERLGVIVAHLDDTHSIQPASLQETEEGYKVSFRDGRGIFIAYGKDGKDGNTLIPVGAKSDEDGLYYWTLNGEWLLGPDGEKIRAGATDGSDGIVPQIKVEDGFWWISLDGGETFAILASIEEMTGVGVFSDVDLSDPSKIVMTLLDGTVLEIPRYRAPLKVYFEGGQRDTVSIAAGERLAIPYCVVVEGDTDLPVVVTSGTDGIYLSEVVEGPQPGQGVVRVQAPAVFAEGYILLNAYCGEYSAIKIISFREREYPEGGVVRAGRAAGSRTVPFEASFEFVASSDAGWLSVAADPSARTLTFELEENPSDTLRTCTVTVSPKDNPDFVCTTYKVVQATRVYTYEVEPGSTLSCELSAESGAIEATAEGGSALIWLTFLQGITVEKCPEWVSAEITAEDGFYKLSVSVGAAEAEEPREGVLTLKVGGTAIPINVKQAGKPSGE